VQAEAPRRESVKAEQPKHVEEHHAEAKEAKHAEPAPVESARRASKQGEEVAARRPSLQGEQSKGEHAPEPKHEEAPRRASKQLSGAPAELARRGSKQVDEAAGRRPSTHPEGSADAGRRSSRQEVPPAEEAKEAPRRPSSQQEGAAPARRGSAEQAQVQEAVRRASKQEPAEPARRASASAPGQEGEHKAEAKAQEQVRGVRLDLTVARALRLNVDDRGMAWRG
jgi:hypothetical protein